MSNLINNSKNMKRLNRRKGMTQILNVQNIGLMTQSTFPLMHSPISLASKRMPILENPQLFASFNAKSPCFFRGRDHWPKVSTWNQMIFIFH